MTTDYGSVAAGFTENKGRNVEIEVFRDVYSMIKAEKWDYGDGEMK